jgi:hypothetical protein
MNPDDVLAREFATIAELIHAHALLRPDHIALMHQECTVSYSGLDRWADRVASTLQRDHVDPGCTIAICAATTLDYVAIFLGSLRAGVAVAPLVGVVFALGWTPCLSPTLGVVVNLGFNEGTALRGGLLGFVYALGLGIPFVMLVAIVRHDEFQEDRALVPDGSSLMPDNYPATSPSHAARPMCSH